MGEETIDEVIVNCLRGDATPPEVNHAIAVRRSSGGLRFEPTDAPYQWVLSTGKLELIHIEGMCVAAVAFSGGPLGDHRRLTTACKLLC